MDQAAGLRARIAKLRDRARTDMRRDVRLLAITSGKGGVGKTNIAVNLSLALAEKQRRVLLVDMDFGFGNADLVMGVSPQFDLGHVMMGTSTFSESLVLGPHGIHMMAASSLEGIMKLSEGQISSFIASMEKEWGNYDYVIFDTGAGINEVVMGCLLAVPEIVLVSTPEPTALADAYALLKSLHHHGIEKKVLRLIMNQVNDQAEAQRSIRSLQTMANKFLNTELQALIWIPRDPAVWKAVRSQKPILLLGTTTPACQALRQAAGLLEQSKSERGNMLLSTGGFFRRWLSYLTH